MSAFPTTRWTLVQNAAGAPEVRRKALGELRDACWKPVFVYYRGLDFGVGALAALLDSLKRIRTPLR